MRISTRAVLAAAVCVVALGVVAFFTLGSAEVKVAGKAAAKPALTVTTLSPQRLDLALNVQATGNVSAWQEAIVGAEAGGLRIAEVRVNVGDVVKRGQVLATFDAATIDADVAQARAALVEAEATLADARANATRARQVEASGAISQQQITQFLTAEKTAAARLASFSAQVTAQELRRRHTTVLAPDSGSISSRTATVGSVVPQGQELFRLIRGDRLEWRAEVTATEIARIQPGQAATVVSATGATAVGRVRVIAPTVDPQTRNALVYVDLPAGATSGGSFKPGMFARGELATGSANVLTLPLAAISLRDGFSYVFTVGPDSRVAQLKVQLGRRSGERVEVLGSLTGNERVVATGAAFLADGDVVRVVAR